MTNVRHHLLKTIHSEFKYKIDMLCNKGTIVIKDEKGN